MTDLPEVPIETDKPSWRDRISLIWLLPIGAVLVALGVAWSSWANQGRLIHVSFKNGAGLLANSTEVRFRDVTVGLVEEIGLSEDLEDVEVAIRLDPKISPYVDNAAQFWVVRPEVTTQGISGLETVLSGVYIEGSWDNVVTGSQSRFQGLSQTPLFRAEKPGLQISLRSASGGQLVAESPILFRGIEVGRVGPASVDPRGRYAVAEAIIYEPHDRLINSSTRFWDTSGFSISVGAAGASIDFSSIASLVAGGITFETFVSGGEQTENGALFQVYETEETARDSIFNQSLVDEILVSSVFDDNISGLTVGAVVELNGVRIGSVQSVFGVVDEEVYGDNRVRLNALMAIQPTRLGLSGDVTPERALEFLRNHAEEGLRAQLVSASILSGGLKVKLATIEDAEPAPVREVEGMMVLPSIESDIQSGQATIETIIGRVNALPVEELMASSVGFLESAQALLSSDAIRETPEDVRKLLATITEVVGSDEVKAIPEGVNEILGRIEQLLTELETAQMVQSVVETIDAARQVVTRVDQSVAGVPELIDELTAVARTAQELPLGELTERVAGVVQSANDLIQSEGVQNIPVQVNEALSELNATLASLRESGGALDNVNATLASARDAADAVAQTPEDLRKLLGEVSDLIASEEVRAIPTGINEILGQVDQLLRQLEAEQLVQSVVSAVGSVEQAVASVDQSIAGVPELIDELTAVARSARELPLEDLTRKVTAIVDSANDLIQSQGVQDLPVQLSDALAELNATLAELREGGAVNNVNEALASARDAADAVAQSTEQLPALAEQLADVLDQASATLEGFNRGEALTRDAQAALRDIQKAADAIAALARTIERNPNALIRGRN